MEIASADASVSPNDRAGQLQNLGVAKGLEYRRTRAVDDLVAAIRHLQEASDLTPSHHPARASRLHDLGIAYKDKYEQTGELDDLELSTRLCREALELSSYPDANRSSLLPLIQPESITLDQRRDGPQCWEHGCNGREFGTFSNLLRHQREKSGSTAKPYCPRCGTEFTKTTARNSHLEHSECGARRSISGIMYDELDRVDQVNNPKSIAVKAEIDVLTKLPSVEGVAYNSSTNAGYSYSSETRIDLLNRITRWTDAPASKSVLWLIGTKGIGKSSIARTLAAKLDESKQLGASFFFKSEGDRSGVSHFFTTIAAQLFQSIPKIRPLIAEVLENEPRIADKPLRLQFEQLILQPLQNLESSDENLVMIVVDGLDECSNEGHVRIIVELLTQLRLVQQMKVRALITSHPKLPVRLGLEMISEGVNPDLVLHEIEITVVKDETYPGQQDPSISSISTPQLSAQVFSAIDSSQIPTTTTRSGDVNKGQSTDDDVLSVYSNDSNISDPYKTGSIEALAGVLTKRILQAPKANRDKIVGRIPDLLKAFASQLGYSNSDRMHLETMVFLRKHRQKITDAIMAQIKEQDGDVYDETDQMQRPNVNVPEMSLNDRMQHWDLAESGNDAQGEDIEWPPEHTASEQQNERDLEAYTKLVLESSHFDWLLCKISRELEFQVLDRDYMEEITKFIITQHASTERVVRRRRPKTIELALTIDWNSSLLDESVEKLGERGFDREEIVSIATLDQSLVLVGTASDAIATTCGEYINMIWFDRGSHLIELLKEALSNLGIIKQKSSDNIDLVAYFDGFQISIKCEGELYAIAEVAEMFGWLACALRASQEGVYAVAPSISKIESRTFDNCPHYHINILSQQVQNKSPSSCWHGMFEDVVVTEGYPIPRRNSTGYGLEISLGIIAKLLRTNRTTVRNGSLAIREYSHALFPTCRMDDIVRWHYIYDTTNIPYWRVHSHNAHDLLTGDLSHYRHFVGWCSQANTIAGAPGDHYDVRRSDLPSPSTNMLLESFNITGSQFVGAQVNIKFGVRRPALHIAADGFAQKIIALRQHYVVLWDHEDKRGWLVDGLSALLHLLRTSLSASSRDKFSQDLFCLDLNSDISEPRGEYPDAAVRFFFQDKKLHPNMKLKIYPGEDEAYLMLDLVKHLCAILQDIIDQQHKIVSKDGFTLTTSLRQNLLGWDFVNIATDHDFYEPYCVNLGYRGAAWVDLVRSIRAVVLFGRGFGEIIQPANSEALCEHWSRLPKHEYYLASYSLTINSIIQRFGKSETTPTKLTNDLVWHSPSRSCFSSCSCKRPSSQGKHSDFTLAIWPARLQSLLPKTTSLASWSNNSAIIFGQNKRFPWYWPNKGDPCKTKPSSSSLIAIPQDADGSSSEITLAPSNVPSSSISRETSQTSLEFGKELLQHSSQGTDEKLWRESGQQASRLQRLAAVVHMKSKPKPPPSS